MTTIIASDVSKLVEAEISRISQPDLVARIKELFVPIRHEQVGWDYGSPGQTYPCWIVAEDPETNLAFAFCEYGFGPTYPWGMFFRGKDQSMGMDNAWYISLEDLFRESLAWDGSNPPDYELN